MGGRRRDHTPLPAAEGAGPTSWPPACPTEPAPRVFLSSVLSPKHRDRAAHMLGLQGLAPVSPHQRGVPGQPGEGHSQPGSGPPQPLLPARICLISTSTRPVQQLAEVRVRFPVCSSLSAPALPFLGHFHSKLIVIAAQIPCPLFSISPHSAAAQLASPAPNQHGLSWGAAPRTGSVLPPLPPVPSLRFWDDPACCLPTGHPSRLPLLPPCRRPAGFSQSLPCARPVTLPHRGSTR